MAHKTDVWMPIYIGDYLADTSHLTTEEHGAYLLLMFHYWRKGPLPSDVRRLASIVGLSGDAWSNAWALLESFFTLGEDGLLHHKRIDHELIEASGKRQKSTERAEKAARARWGNAPSNAQASPQALLDECPSPSPSPSPSQEKHVSEAKASSPRKSSGTPDPIEEIYKAYPRKVGRRGALKAIAKAIQQVRNRGMTVREAQEWLYRQVQAYARSPAGQNGELTPHPATWFNRGSYDDDQQEWQHKSSERGTHGNQGRNGFSGEEMSRLLDSFGGSETDQPVRCLEGTLHPPAQELRHARRGEGR
jgi:uncharacterized protein YdaU (DUF1376 family)